MKLPLGRKLYLSTMLMAALTAGHTPLFNGTVSAQSAYAAIPRPRIKPEPPALSNYISEADAKLFRKGLRNVKAGSWKSVDRDIQKINDPTAKDILRWLRASRDRNASTEELKYVIENLSDWPRMTRIQSKAETRMFDTPLSANDTVIFFAGRDPISGEGRAALARAHYDLGDTSSGDKWLRLAWRESKLTRDRQKKLFSKYRKRLNQDDHAARADHLIWQGRAHYDKANALLTHMGREDRALMTARLKLAQNASGMDAALKAVPARLSKDAGLLYERGRWRRKKRTKDYALPTYLDITIPPTSEDGQKALWREKKIMSYWAIEEKDYPSLYGLVTNHGMSRGASFAEAEFLAGWVSLTQLGRPKVAIDHFTRLRDGVSRPVSLARAHYWLGRAHEAQRDGQDFTHYAQAAQYPNTYYGQLAALKQDGSSAQISLPPELVPDLSKTQFDNDRRIRALHILGEAGETTYFSQFAFHLDDELPDEYGLSLLSQLSKDYGFMRPSVRAAKQAGRFQTMLTESGYPRIAAIDALPAKFDLPFVYAIARQESEFETNVVSSAKAYGLMQMINGTAKATARKHRVPYDRVRLGSDGDYAANLGALHLHDLLDRFDGSYILAAVSYNAGPHRAQSWIKKYGDPRSVNVDAIDWVEKIPFSETRNYVQRVMENMQVYRARLNNDTGANLLETDLNKGKF
ncbi:MAG: lytic transglycosylase domain-containing protein [Litorimonas sp.]